MHILTHANCPDGIMSALVYRLRYGDVPVTFCQYGKPLPAPAAGQVFVDFSPPADLAPAYVAAGAQCLDHHPTAEAVVRLFGDSGTYRNGPGISGATLALEDCYPDGDAWDQLVPMVTLAGIRDTWQKDSPLWEEACDQAAGLLFWPAEDLLTVARDATRLPELEAMLAVGKPARKRHLDRCREALAGAAKGVYGGVTWTIFQGADLASDAADMADTDLVVGVKMEADRTVFSCRSRKGVDVSALAKMYGGGGHRAAAGFTMERKPEVEDMHPFQVFWDAFVSFHIRSSRLEAP